MTRTDAILAVTILVLGIAAAVIYLRTQGARREEREAALTPEQRRELDESPVCDPIRSEITRAQAELASIQWDPVKEGNIRGFLNIKNAELVECERTERRNRLRASL